MMDDFLALLQLANLTDISENDVCVAWSKGGLIRAIGLAPSGTSETTSSTWKVLVFEYGDRNLIKKVTIKSNVVWSDYYASAS